MGLLSAKKRRPKHFCHFYWLCPTIVVSPLELTGNSGAPPRQISHMEWFRGVCFITHPPHCPPGEHFPFLPLLSPTRGSGGGTLHRPPRWSARLPPSVPALFFTATISHVVYFCWAEDSWAALTLTRRNGSSGQDFHTGWGELSTRGDGSDEKNNKWEHMAQMARNLYVTSGPLQVCT